MNISCERKARHISEVSFDQIKVLHFHCPKYHCVGCIHWRSVVAKWCSTSTPQRSSQKRHNSAIFGLTIWWFMIKAFDVACRNLSLIAFANVAHQSYRMWQTLMKRKLKQLKGINLWIWGCQGQNKNWWTIWSPFQSGTHHHKFIHVSLSNVLYQQSRVSVTVLVNTAHYILSFCRTCSC